MPHSLLIQANVGSRVNQACGLVQALDQRQTTGTLPPGALAGLGVWVVGDSVVVNARAATVSEVVHVGRWGKGSYWLDFGPCAPLEERNGSELQPPSLDVPQVGGSMLRR